MYLDNMEKMKFYKAAADDVSAFEEHQTTAKPIFYMYLQGKQHGDPIIGLQGPQIEAAVKDLAESVE